MNLTNHRTSVKIKKLPWVVDVEGHGPMGFETEEEAEAVAEELRQDNPELIVEVRQRFHDKLIN